MRFYFTEDFVKSPSSMVVYMKILFFFCPEMHTQKPQHGLKKLVVTSPHIPEGLPTRRCCRPHCPRTSRMHAPGQVWGSGMSAVGLQTSESIEMEAGLTQGGLQNQDSNHMQQWRLAAHAWAVHSGHPVQRVLFLFV